MADTERKTLSPESDIGKATLSAKEMLSAALSSVPAKKRLTASPPDEKRNEAAAPPAQYGPGDAGTEDAADGHGENGSSFKPFKKLKTGKRPVGAAEEEPKAATGRDAAGEPAKEGLQETLKNLKHRMRRIPCEDEKEEGADTGKLERISENAEEDGLEKPQAKQEQQHKQAVPAARSLKDKEGAKDKAKQSAPRKTPSRSKSRSSGSRGNASEWQQQPKPWGKEGPADMLSKPFTQTLAAAMAASGGTGDVRQAAAAMASAAAAAASAEANRAAHVMKALQQRQVCWQGRVKHKMENSLVELFHLAAAIPAELAEQFPPALYVSELRHRSEVVLSKHTWARCAAKTLSEKQAAKLQLLSDNKLVAIVRLQHCELILVPDIDPSSGAIRMAGFLLSNPIY